MFLTALRARKQPARCLGFMPELLRSVVTRLREFVGNRRRHTRYRVRLRVTLALVAAKSRADGTPRSPVLEGYTRDISATGLAIILPAIRIGDRYLTGEDQTLDITLEHSTGPIHLHASSVRYEKLDEEETEKGYLIGVRITEMEDEDRTRFTACLRTSTEKE
jgi:glucose-6-phosphate-specific signal transduction histidine kinase